MRTRTPYSKRPPRPTNARSPTEPRVRSTRAAHSWRRSQRLCASARRRAICQQTKRCSERSANGRLRATASRCGGRKARLHGRRAAQAQPATAHVDAQPSPNPFDAAPRQESEISVRGSYRDVISFLRDLSHMPTLARVLAAQLDRTNNGRAGPRRGDPRANHPPRSHDRSRKKDRMNPRLTFFLTATGRAARNGGLTAAGGFRHGRRARSASRADPRAGTNAVMQSPPPASSEAADTNENAPLPTIAVQRDPFIPDDANAAPGKTNKARCSSPKCR